MMKQYHIYVFTQESCAPCDRLKTFVETLDTNEVAELDFVPFKTPSGEQTALASQLNVEFTPTMVVCYEALHCEIDPDGDEYCDLEEESVERFVGANSIIEHLQATLDAYTYAHPE
jgi:hypothetical protein